jgi:hypothetical protein
MLVDRVSSDVSFSHGMQVMWMLRRWSYSLRSSDLV